MDIKGERKGQTYTEKGERNGQRQADRQEKDTERVKIDR